MEFPKPLPIENELKERYLKKFKEDIIHQQQLKANEKQNKILEEREYLNKVQREIEEEKMKKQLYRMQNINNQLSDYNNHLERKKVYEIFIVKIEEQKKIEQKLIERNLTSLNMNSEQRLTQLKQYIGKLDENVEKNMEYHKQYLQANAKSNHNTSDSNIKHEVEQTSLQIPNHNSLESKIDAFSSNRNLEENYQFNDQNYANNSQSNIVYNKSNKNNDYEPKQLANEGNTCEDPSKIYRDQRIMNQSIPNDYSNKNNRNYQEYYNVKRDYLNYNKNMIENKFQQSINMKEEKRRIADERMKELERNMNFESEMKKNQIEQQKIYRNMLDGQKKERFPLQTMNERSTPQDDKYYYYKNNSVSNPPCKYRVKLDIEKKYELGGTILEHNPILNPVPYYKNNKYLYRDGIVNSSLKFVGNNIIG